MGAHVNTEIMIEATKIIAIQYNILFLLLIILDLPICTHLKHAYWENYNLQNMRLVSVVE